MSNEALERIVERCRAGDDHAWEELVDATADDLYRMAVSFTRNRGRGRGPDPGRLPQALAEPAPLRCPGRRSGPGPSAWRATCSSTPTGAPATCARPPGSTRSSWTCCRAPTTRTPSTVRKQRLDLARTALARLPEELAQLLLLRDFADWSYEELADELDVAAGHRQVAPQPGAARAGRRDGLQLTPRAAMAPVGARP